MDKSLQIKNVPLRSTSQQKSKAHSNQDNSTDSGKDVNSTAPFSYADLFALGLTLQDIELYESLPKTTTDNRITQILSTLRIPKYCILYCIFLCIVSKATVSSFLRVVYHYCEARKELQNKLKSTTVFNFGLRSFFETCNIEISTSDKQQSNAVDSMQDLLLLSRSFFLLLVAVDKLDFLLQQSSSESTRILPQPMKSATTQIQFDRPIGCDIIDRYAFFVLHEDGIECASQFAKGSEYYCITLELLNCNSLYRANRAMTLFACVLQKKKGDKDSEKKMLETLDEYIRMVTLSGLRGVYINQNGVWSHWHWIITGICGDLVAEQQVIGEANKMNTFNPCIGKSCEKVVFSFAEYGYQKPYEPRFCALRKEAVMFPPAFNQFDSVSGYRLASFIAHSSNPIKEILDEGYTLTDAQRSEIQCMKAYYNLFPRSNVFQFLPVVTDFRKYWKWKEEEFVSTIGDEFDSELFFSADKKPEKVISIHPEEGLLIPKSICMVQDAMHFITNLMYGFLLYLNATKKDADSSEEVFFNDTITVAIFGKRGVGISLYYPNECIISKAKTRLQALPLSRLSGVSSFSLDPKHFKAMKSHDCMVFALSLFSYLFQDSMKFPAIHAMKNILDIIGAVFNCDCNYLQMIRMQEMLDFHLGVLQGEIAPSFITPSIHNVVHPVSSTIIHGSAAVNNSLIQEAMYRYAKNAVTTSPNPSKTTQWRLLVSNTTEVYSLEKLSSDQAELNTPINEVGLQWIRQHLDEMEYLQLSLDNVRMDTVLHHSDCISVNCSVDSLLHCYYTSSQSSDATTAAPSHSSDHFLCSIPFIPDKNQSAVFDFSKQRRGFDNGMHIQSFLAEAKCNGERVKAFVYDGQASVSLPSVSDSIAFTRLFTGEVVPLLVVGFTVEMVDGDYPFYQALVTPLEASSGNCGITTQQYCVASSLLSSDSGLTSLLDSCRIIPISVNRLVFNSCVVTTYNVKQLRYGFSFSKLSIRQSKPIYDNPLFPYMEGKTPRKPITRSFTTNNT